MAYICGEYCTYTVVDMVHTCKTMVVRNFEKSRNMMLFFFELWTCLKCLKPPAGISGPTCKSSDTVEFLMGYHLASPTLAWGEENHDGSKSKWLRSRSKSEWLSSFAGKELFLLTVAHSFLHGQELAYSIIHTSFWHVNTIIGIHDGPTTF